MMAEKTVEMKAGMMVEPTDETMVDQKADAKADSMDVPMAAQTADYLVAW